MKMLRGSHFKEELLIVHNLNIQGERKVERTDFDYGMDFCAIYRPLGDGYIFTRTFD